MATATLDRSQQRREYDEATAGLKFTKDFMTAIEAVMRDEMAPIGQRIMAWIKFTSWGRYSLFCINEDGTEAFQSDCARDLKIDRRRVSDTFRYFEARGYLERRGIAKVVYPSISPVLTGPDPSIVNMSEAHRTFLDLWCVQCAPDNKELQVHLAAVKRIIKVRNAKEAAWRADGTNPGASLMRDVESPEDIYVEEETAAAAAAGAPAPAYSVIEKAPEQPSEESPPPSVPALRSQDPWKQIRDVLHRMDRTATAGQVGKLVETCRKAKDGLTPEVLAEVIATWPIGTDIRSAVAYLSKELPALLSDDDRLYQYLQDPQDLRFNNGNNRARDPDDENRRLAAELDAIRGI